MKKQLTVTNIEVKEKMFKATKRNNILPFIFLLILCGDANASTFNVPTWIAYLVVFPIYAIPIFYVINRLAHKENRAVKYNSVAVGTISFSILLLVACSYLDYGGGFVVFLPLALVFFWRLYLSDNTMSSKSDGDKN